MSARSVRDKAIESNPDFPWLQAESVDAIGSFMRDRDWLAPGESVISCEPAGAGNMNLTLRVRTDRRDLVLKQSRPWVEKFDHIEAPWGRALVEIEFYQIVSTLVGVREHMPAMLDADKASRCFALQYVEGDGDFTFVYELDSKGVLERETLDQAAQFLAALHRGTLRSPEPRLSNLEMRQLNRDHIFAIPLANPDDTGLDLDALEPGLAAAARALREDRSYRDEVARTERHYLADGSSLLHGDFFPGSWLSTEKGLVVIDPEFCFYGAIEIDLGCTIAHLALSGQPHNLAINFVDEYRNRAQEIDVDESWVARFAAVEIMRRLIGVAQLPLPVSKSGSHFRLALLERSRQGMLEGNLDRLFDSR